VGAVGTPPSAERFLGGGAGSSPTMREIRAALEDLRAELRGVRARESLNVDS